MVYTRGTSFGEEKLNFCVLIVAIEANQTPIKIQG